MHLRLSVMRRMFSYYRMVGFVCTTYNASFCKSMGLTLKLTAMIGCICKEVVDMTIKEFSELCNCTTQTLRYYDGINLLKPARVDQFTGYRYYESVQALDYIKIKNLQDAMFSIEEIKEILGQEDYDITKAFDVKIAEQEAKLERIKKIQMSYRKDYMRMKDLIKRTQDKLNESVGSYDAAKEYGITEEYYKAIIQSMNEQYAQTMEEQKYSNFRFVELNSNSENSKVKNPIHDNKNTVVFEESGWKYTADILKKISTLEGDYILYFELNEEKWSYNDFCMVVLRVIQDRSKDINFNIEVSRNRSKDLINHFWLLKK